MKLIEAIHEVIFRYKDYPNLEAKNDKYVKEKIETAEEIEELKDSCMTLLNQVSDLNEEYEEKELNKRLLEKYPSKKISWNARSLPFSTTKCRVPVQVLITPTDPYIIQDLKDWGLYKTGEDDETLIPKIYKKVFKKYYKYEFDKNVWGTNEVWEFPFELRAKGFTKGFDCDSWANFLVSYFRASGLPAGKVWVVAGDTDLGGHSTVYVWSDVTEVFHHLNSTYGTVLWDKMSDYPTHADAEFGYDKIGIKKVWVSYNDIIARSKFDKKRIGELIIEK